MKTQGSCLYGKICYEVNKTSDDIKEKRGTDHVFFEG